MSRRGHLVRETLLLQEGTWILRTYHTFDDTYIMHHCDPAGSFAFETKEGKTICRGCQKEAPPGMVALGVWYTWQRDELW